MFYFSEPHPAFHIRDPDAVPYRKPEAKFVPECRTAQTLGGSTVHGQRKHTHSRMPTWEGDHSGASQQHRTSVSAKWVYWKLTKNSLLSFGAPHFEIWAKGQQTAFCPRTCKINRWNSEELSAPGTLEFTPEKHRFLHHTWIFPSGLTVLDFFKARKCYLIPQTAFPKTLGLQNPGT